MSNRKKFMLGTVSGVISAAMLAGVLMTGIPVPMTTGGQNDAVYGIQAQAASYQLQGPTQQEIVSFFKAHPFYVDRATEYDTPYSKTQPYAQGAVSAVNRQEALNALNFVRYIAGIPSDVQLKDSYNDGCQIGSLVNAANNELSHYPSKPEGMSDELYNQQMSGKSNIAWNYGNLSKTVVYAWLHDTDSYNMAALGHRRWVLYPEMQYTGFGQVETYNSMYAFDRSRSDTFAGDYIAWPAANTPYELMNDRWGEQAVFSVSLKNCTIPDKSAVKVTMKSTKLNKTWVLDQNSQDTDSAYLNIDTAYYGYQPCIIFRTEELPENDTVDISITGVTKNGSARPIQYTVQFFNMSDIQLNQSSVNLEKGKTFQLTADYASMYSYDSTLTWTSSNQNVVTVQDGKLTAVGAGTAVVTAKNKSGKTATCQVNVTVPVVKVTSVKLNKTSVTIEKTKSVTMTAAIEPANATDKTLTWVTDNKSVANVSNGVITAKGVGQCVITAKSANGVKARVNVTVVPVLHNGSTITNDRVQVGDKVRVVASASGGSGSYQYAYYFKRKSNSTWNLLGTKFGTNSSVTFTPTAAVDYEAKVIVRDSNGIQAEKRFTVTAVDKMALTNVSTVNRTESSVGKAVTMTGKVVGGASSYTYAFYFKRSTNSTWKLLGDKFGTAATAKLKPTAAGTYDIRIIVKDAAGNTDTKLYTLTVK